MAAFHGSDQRGDDRHGGQPGDAYQSQVSHGDLSCRTGVQRAGQLPVYLCRLPADASGIPDPSERHHAGRAVYHPVRHTVFAGNGISARCGLCFLRGYQISVYRPAQSLDVLLRHFLSGGTASGNDRQDHRGKSGVQLYRLYEERHAVCSLADAGTVDPDACLGSYHVCGGKPDIPPEPEPDHADRLTGS